MELNLELNTEESDERFDVGFLNNLPNLQNFSLLTQGRPVLHDTIFHKNIQIRSVHLETNDPDSIPNNLFENSSMLKKVVFQFSTPRNKQFIPKYLPLDLFENNLLLEEVIIKAEIVIIDFDTFSKNWNLKVVHLQSFELAYIPFDLFSRKGDFTLYTTAHSAGTRNLEKSICDRINPL